MCNKSREFYYNPLISLNVGYSALRAIPFVVNGLSYVAFAMEGNKW